MLDTEDVTWGSRARNLGIGVWKGLFLVIDRYENRR